MYSMIDINRSGILPSRKAKRRFSLPRWAQTWSSPWSPWRQTRWPGWRRPAAAARRPASWASVFARTASARTPYRSASAANSIVRESEAWSLAWAVIFVLPASPTFSTRWGRSVQCSFFVSRQVQSKRLNVRGCLWWYLTASECDDSPWSISQLIPRLPVERRVCHEEVRSPGTLAGRISEKSIVLAVDRYNQESHGRESPQFNFRRLQGTPHTIAALQRSSLSWREGSSTCAYRTLRAWVRFT